VKKCVCVPFFVHLFRRSPRIAIETMIEAKHAGDFCVGSLVSDHRYGIAFACRDRGSISDFCHPCDDADAMTVDRFCSSVIYFYRAEQPYGCFSNFSDHAIVLDDRHWQTTEHFYQAHKFDPSDPLAGAWFAQIAAADSPAIAAHIGRSHPEHYRPDWDRVKIPIMYRAVRQKFLTHPAIRQVLLDTGEAMLVENSPVDYFWGCGTDGTGQNQLGKLLMQLRAEFRRSGSCISCK